jgi:uncharacterized protein YukE
MPDLLHVPLDQLLAAQGQFRGFQAQAERVKATVMGEVDALGISWFGDARKAFDEVIDHWISDYQANVLTPLNGILDWLRDAIGQLAAAEAQNTQN